MTLWNLNPRVSTGLWQLRGRLSQAVFYLGRVASLSYRPRS